MNTPTNLTEATEALEVFLVDKTSFTKQVKACKTKANVLAMFEAEKVKLPKALHAKSTRKVLEEALINGAYPLNTQAELEILVTQFNTPKENNKMNDSTAVEPVEPVVLVIEDDEDYEAEAKALLKALAIKQAKKQGGRLSIKQATNYLGVTPERIRGILKEGRLDSEKVAVNPDNPKTVRHMITVASLDAYNLTKGKKSGAKDHIIRVTPALMEKIITFCATHDEELADDDSAEKFGDIKPRLRYDMKKAKAKKAEKEAKEATTEEATAE